MVSYSLASFYAYDYIFSFNESEKELIMEIERLKKQRIIPKNERNSNKNYEKIIKSTEDERDYWKAEVETLQDIIKTVSAPPIETNESSSDKKLEEVTITHLKSNAFVLMKSLLKFPRILNKLKKREISIKVNMNY